MNNNNSDRSSSTSVNNNNKDTPNLQQLQRKLCLACSVASFHESSLREYQIGVQTNLQHALQLTAVRNHKTTAPKHAVFTNLCLCYDEQLLQDILQSIPWKELCEDYDDRTFPVVKDNAATAATVAAAVAPATPLLIVLNTLRNPCHLPTSCCLSLARTLARLLVVLTQSGGRNQPTQPNGTSRKTNRLQWPPSRQRLLETLNGLLRTIPALRSPTTVQHILLPLVDTIVKDHNVDDDNDKGHGSNGRHYQNNNHHTNHHHHHPLVLSNNNDQLSRLRRLLSLVKYWIKQHYHPNQLVGLLMILIHMIAAVDTLEQQQQRASVTPTKIRGSVELNEDDEDDDFNAGDGTKLKRQHLVRASAATAVLPSTAARLLPDWLHGELSEDDEQLLSVVLVRQQQRAIRRHQQSTRRRLASSILNEDAIPDAFHGRKYQTRGGRVIGQ